MTTQTQKYDYIVVGSGAGGGPVAANLAEAGFSVLLLEAGDDARPVAYDVPVFHAISSEEDSMKWDFFVRHYGDDATQKRDNKFTAAKDGVLYPRAGTLGGCTAHNAMICAYPHNSDWEYISTLVGDESWSGRNMRRYFIKLENCHYHPIWRTIYKLTGWNPKQRGYSGWLHTQAPNPTLVLKDKTLIETLAGFAIAAFTQLSKVIQIGKGLGALLDPNDIELVNSSAEGLRFAPTSTMNGKRVSTRDRLNAVKEKHPDKLEIRMNALATRILFDDNMNAIGVEYRNGKHLYRAHAAPQDGGDLHQCFCAKEVIVSGGAFNTPQLLKLSGIGPKAELEKFGIPVRVDLPGVGENLQDRYEVGVVTRLNKDLDLLKGATVRPPEPGEKPDPSFVEWETQGKGLYTTNGAVLAVIAKSQPKCPEPDLFMFALAGKFSGYFPGYSKEISRQHNYITWAILKAHTNNTAGYVRLRSADPADVPDINFRYFDEGNDLSGDDLNSVVEGVEFVRRMNRQSKNFIAEEEIPGKDCDTREKIAQFIKDNAWGHHASCTCKIGAPGDPMAVLDGDFRVRGTKGLRVVDASVFPKIPGFFIVSAVYMIAEKASEVIIQDAKR